MFKFSAVSQIWKKYIQKLNDWDLPLSGNNKTQKKFKLTLYYGDIPNALSTFFR